EKLCEDMANYELQAGFQCPDEPDVPAFVAAQLYQCVRELLFNVVKYAKAKRAWVRCEGVGDRIVISVEDDGAGISPSQADSKPALDHGFGLFTIRER